MKNKTFLVLIAIALGLSACSAFESAPPSIYLRVDGETIAGLPGGYCWDQLVGGTYCVDPFEPTFDTPIPLPAGTPIRLTLDSPLPQSLDLTLTTELYGDDVTAENLTVSSAVEWTPQVPPGEYILNANATWNQGSVTYRFFISLP